MKRKTNNLSLSSLSMNHLKTVGIIAEKNLEQLPEISVIYSLLLFSVLR